MLKLREGAYVAAEAHQTEQLLHGYLAAVDERVRCFVLEGEGRAAERARAAVAALRELGCDVTLVPTRHPVVDIVRFQRLTVDLAEARGVDPDRIRRDDERWARAAASKYDSGRLGADLPAARRWAPARARRAGDARTERMVVGRTRPRPRRRSSRPVDEAARLPVAVDRGALVVDEPGVASPSRWTDLEVEVGLDLRRLLRPGDPEAVRRSSVRLSFAKRLREVGRARREEDDDAGARLRAELRRAASRM